jgi:hypothetical protein
MLKSTLEKCPAGHASVCLNPLEKKLSALYQDKLKAEMANNDFDKYQALLMQKQSLLSSMTGNNEQLADSSALAVFQNAARVYNALFKRGYGIEGAKLMESYFLGGFALLCTLVSSSLFGIRTKLTLNENVSYKTFSATIPEKKEPESWEQRFKTLYSRQKHKPFFSRATTATTRNDTVMAAATSNTPVSVATDNFVDTEDLKKLYQRGVSERLSDTPVSLEKSDTNDYKSSSIGFTATPAVSTVSKVIRPSVSKMTQKKPERITVSSDTTELIGYSDVVSAIKNGVIRGRVSYRVIGDFLRSNGGTSSQPTERKIILKLKEDNLIDANNNIVEVVK